MDADVNAGQKTPTHLRRFLPAARAIRRIGRPAGRQRPVVSVLAYGGDRSEQRDECRALPWNQIKDFDWAG